MRISIFIVLLTWSFFIGGSYETSSCRFQCDNGRTINSVYVCDWNDNCGDGSDERGCACTAEKNRFRCANGTCIEVWKRCDWWNDCGDNSDEHNCECNDINQRFQCKNGNCTAYWLTCDSHDDCGDNSDEIGCGCNSSSHKFLCANGHCIYDDQRCDGRSDCDDDSDEVGCECFSRGESIIADCVTSHQTPDCFIMSITIWEPLNCTLPAFQDMCKKYPSVSDSCVKKFAQCNLTGSAMENELMSWKRLNESFSYICNEGKSGLLQLQNCFSPANLPYYVNVSQECMDNVCYPNDWNNTSSQCAYYTEAYGCYITSAGQLCNASEFVRTSIMNMFSSYIPDCMRAHVSGYLSTSTVPVTTTAAAAAVTNPKPGNTDMIGATTKSTAQGKLYDGNTDMIGATTKSTAQGKLYDVSVKATITLKDYTFQTDYSDLNSNLSQALKTAVCNSYWTILNGTNLKSCTVVRFTPGSVIVDTQLNYTVTSTNTEPLVAQMTTAINNGQQIFSANLNSTVSGVKLVSDSNFQLPGQSGSMSIHNENLFGILVAAIWAAAICGRKYQ